MTEPIITQPGPHSHILPRSPPRETNTYDPNDSGYSSQSTTPNVPKDTLTGKDEKLGGAQRGSPMPFVLPPGVNKKSLVPFSDLVIGEVSRQRFRAIQPHFEKLLLEHIRANQRANAKYKPMSARLMMLGTTEVDACPHVVVFCQSEQKMMVQKFVKTDDIKNLCETCDEGIPSFPVTVFGNAPRLRLAVDCVDVIAEQEELKTLVGLPISLRHPWGFLRSATSGGMIKVVWNTGEMELFGITAGHVVQQIDDELTTLCCDFTDFDDSFGGGTKDLENIFGPDILGMDEEDGSYEESEPIETWSFAQPMMVGNLVRAPAETTYSGLGYFDWALFTLTSYPMNTLNGRERNRLTVSDKSPGMTGRRHVFVTSGSGTIRAGILSAESGRIILGPGEQFVDTHMLTIHEGLGIRDGDSGVWVVDSSNFQIYGHLVASDMFGGGYIIPMKDVLEDIRRRLGAQAVNLPNIIDILHVKEIEAANGPRRFPPQMVSFMDYNPLPQGTPLEYSNEDQSYLLDGLQGAQTPILSSECDSGYASKNNSPSLALTGQRRKAASETDSEDSPYVSSTTSPPPSVADSRGLTFDVGEGSSIIRDLTNKRPRR